MRGFSLRSHANRLIVVVLLASLAAAMWPIGLPISTAQPIGVSQAPDAVDLRQNGSIEISGNLVEGGRVYLRIPVKNFGSTTSVKVHTYTEGYTSQGSLWRADGAQPTAVNIAPGQTVYFQVQHDLWAGHLGVWSTYGVYLWNDSTGGYYGPLPANGYNQAVLFSVTLDVRQAGAIQVSGTLVEGNKVYLTVPVKNFGGSATPALHAYVEGHTALGNLFRADGAQPTAVVIQPGQTVNFTVQHDLWLGHAGTWTTSGVYLWNDASNGYYGPLIANGYNQAISFNVASGPKLQQDGAIQVSGNLVPGGKVYLDIPVKNVGGTASPAIHPYTEGYTARSSLWRADGAQPTAVVMQPGQRTVFRVQHDLWPGHEGTWTTYGVYLWNDTAHTYFSPLTANGNSQTINFNVQSGTPAFSLKLPFTHQANDNGLSHIWSFFDHEYPKFLNEPTGTTTTIVKYNGRRETGTIAVCTRNVSCYSSHNGYDFSLGDGIYAGAPVKAAHAGQAYGTTLTCLSDNSTIYLLQVTSGQYRTVYLHVKNDATWQSFHDNPRNVAAGDTIASIGNTGGACSSGYHLHFGVYYDANNDSTFAASEYVDPYGFDPTKTDPWPAFGGTASKWLWEFSAPSQADVSPGSGPNTTLSNANVNASIPNTAVTNPASVALMPAPEPEPAQSSVVALSHSTAPDANKIQVGQVFQVTGVHNDGTTLNNFAASVTISAAYADADLTYANESTIGLYYWSDTQLAWQAVATTLNMAANTATATTTNLGVYSLRATPLYAAPAVMSVSPTASPNTNGTLITINGSGFKSGLWVNLDMTSLELVQVSATQLKANVPAGITPGTYNLLVRNPDGQEAFASNALAIGYRVFLPVVRRN